MKGFIYQSYQRFFSAEVVLEKRSTTFMSKGFLSAVFLVIELSQVVLFKVGFEEGISRQASYTALAILHIALVGTSTCFFLPATRILPPSVRKARKYEAPNYKQEKETFIEDTANLDKGT